MDAIIQNAIDSRSRHFRLGQPMTSIGEGFKEANIAHDFSAAFQKSAYYVFPEFPFEGGSIDAVFVKDTEVVVCEWKRCYAGSFGSIVDQTQRMLRFDPAVELPKHGFKPQDWVTRWLWVCDAWDEPTVDWWCGRAVSAPLLCPFKTGWSIGDHRFPGLRWLYVWLWAYK
jgi:hypothetical protein